MNRKTGRLVKLGASISLAGGLIAAASISLAGNPAYAASPNESYAAAAGGAVTISPVAEATFPGTSPGTVATISSAGLLSAGAVTDTADATDASSTVANVNVTLLALVALTATEVQSSCTFNTNTDTVSGTTTITSGSISTLIPISLAVNPAPNTGVSVPGVTSVVLNQQTTAGDGTLTVNALAITIGSQTLTVGTSVCNDATLAPVPALPGMAKPIGLGVAGLLGLGGVGFYFRKRRRLALER